MLAFLFEGTDQNLPLLHILVRLSYKLFGVSEFSTRLPALVGFWVLLGCLFLFLRRRVSLSCAFAGTLFPIVTLAWQYSFEGRAYGLLLGCAAAALFCWQSAAAPERPSRFWWLAGISVALAAALSSHCMGVLLAIPLVAGEAVRTLTSKRIDWAMWLAFAIPAPLVLLYPRYLAVARTWDVSGRTIDVNSIVAFYPELLHNSIAPLIFAGAVAAGFALILARREKEPAPEFPPHELAALAGCLFAPPLFFAAAIFTHSFSYSARYGLISVIGAGGLLSLLLARITRVRAGAAAAFAVALGVWITGARFRESQVDRRPPAVQVESVHQILVDALRDGLPVLVTQPHIFLQADYYLPSDLLERSYFVTDPANDRNYVAQHMIDQLTTNAAQHFPLRSHVTPWSEFKSNRRFLLHTGSGYDQWIFDRLLREGWRVTVRSHNDAESVYEVNAPAQ
jgi:hypothetical protein